MWAYNTYLAVTRNAVCTLLQSHLFSAIGAPLKNTIPSSSSGDKLKGRPFARTKNPDGSIELTVKAARFRSVAGDLFRSFITLIICVIVTFISYLIFGVELAFVVFFVALLLTWNLFKYTDDIIKIYPGKGIEFSDYTVPFSDIESIYLNNIGNLNTIYLLSNNTRVVVTAGDGQTMEQFFKLLEDEVKNELSR